MTTLSLLNSTSNFDGDTRMKAFSSACVFTAFLLGSFMPLQADTFETQRCINMGNALDAPKEGEWGHTIEADSFKAIADAGFDTVRIPVRWSAYTAGPPSYKIEEAFFNRVTQVIDQALANNLHVILNVHHFEELNTAPLEHTAKLIALWDQIATRYQNLPKSVYFEVINEPNGEFKGDLMRSIMAKAFEKIRETNPTRMVILGGENWSGIKSLPSIPAIKDPNLVYTFHYYDPFKFTHQKTSWTNLKDSGSVNWGSREDYAELKAAANYAAQVRRETGVPLFMGEIGAYEKAPYNDVVKYTRETRKAFEGAGVSWCVWNFTATFPFYDSETKTWDKKKLAALGLSSKNSRAATIPKARPTANSPFEGQSIDDAFNSIRRTLGKDGDLIMAPFADNLGKYGSIKTKLVKDSGVPDGKAIEVKINKGRNPWAGGLSGPVPGAIKRGDTLVMSYWAKSVKGEGVISNAGLQINQAPYTALKMKPANLTTKWQQFFVTTTAPRDFKPAKAGYAFQLAGARQTIRIGPVFVLNLGQNVDVSRLPGN